MVWARANAVDIFLSTSLFAKKEKQYSKISSFNGSPLP